MEKVIISSVQDFETTIASIVERLLEKHFGSFRNLQPPPEEFLTRRDAAKMLGVALSTLNEYTKSGTVTGYRIGACVRYKRSEIEASLRAIRSYKKI